jgi:hypothetical protein
VQSQGNAIAPIDRRLGAETRRREEKASLYEPHPGGEKTTRDHDGGNKGGDSSH